MSRCKILFILKHRHQYGPYTNPGPYGFSSGLYNSAKFAADMLAANGYTVKLVEVTDNNDIDREVSQFQPKIVIIEALWVVPEKFEVLSKLHPGVVWIVRVHSEGAFLSQEGIAIDWISRYPLFPNTYVSMNSAEGFMEAATVFSVKGISPLKLRYLPTFYPAPKKLSPLPKFSKKTINVACLGALRVLKNTLLQAIAALRFATIRGFKLLFHINSTRTEADGNSPLRNLNSLFAGTKHQLVQHDWMSHEEFTRFLRQMDIGLQVSLGETFSIVSADMVAAGLPIVGSPAITWLDKNSQADPNSTLDVVAKMDRALKGKDIKRNLKNLQRNAQQSQADWLADIGNLCAA